VRSRKLPVVSRQQSVGDAGRAYGRGNLLWVLFSAAHLSQLGLKVSSWASASRWSRERFCAALKMAIVGGGVLALVTALLSVPPIRAADATPAAFDTDPARCVVEPRSLDDLERIVASATPAVPVGRPPSGDWIDPSSDSGRAAVATIETFFACLNAGDRLRAYALATDAYLATILQPGDLPAVATPQPNDPDELTRIIAIELHTLDDGGIIATVTLDPALIPVDKIFEFVLVSSDDGWKIDAVINEIDFSLP